MDFQENLQKCRDYIKALEDEKRKIEMFRRELPLCLNLVTQAIETYKQQLSVPSNTTTTTTTTTITTEHCLNRSHSDCSEQTTSDDDDGGCPVLSEFIPIKRRQPSTSTTETSEAEDEQEEDEHESCDHHESRSLDIDINSDINECKLMMNCDLNDKVCSTSSCSSPDVGEKVDWLRSVQLWNQSSDPSANSITHKEEDLISHRPKKVQVVEVNKGTSAGAFHPFQKEIIAIPTTNKMELCQGNTGVTPTVDMEMACGSGSAANSKKDHDHGLCNKDKDGNGQSRKARRCWSADLHKKFINALQQLGGSHAATPKQIRELMKVDGLTNDEVKSHLQKYRLNCRRPSPAIQNCTTTTHQTPQFVVVGGIWVPSPPTEYATASPTTIAVPTQNGVHIPVAQKVQQPLHNQATITTGSTQSQSEEMRVNRNNHSHNNNSSSSKGRCSGSGRTSSSFSGLLVSN